MITQAEWTIMATGWLGLIVAALSPGPNMFAVVAASLGGGLKNGLQVNLGVALGALMWATLANLGLAALFHSLPGAVMVLSALGAAYLWYLAFKGLRSVFGSAGAPMIDPKGEQSLVRNVFHGLAVTFSNPKVALFWASISTVIASVTTKYLSLLVFAVGASCAVFVVYGGFAVAFSIPRFRQFYARFRPVIDGVFGAVFVGLGLLVLSNIWSV